MRMRIMLFFLHNGVHPDLVRDFTLSGFYCNVDNAVYTQVNYILSNWRDMYTTYDTTAGMQTRRDGTETPEWIAYRALNGKNW